MKTETTLTLDDLGTEATIDDLAEFGDAVARHLGLCDWATDSHVRIVDGALRVGVYTEDGADVETTRGELDDAVAAVYNAGKWSGTNHAIPTKPTEYGEVGHFTTDAIIVLEGGSRAGGPGGWGFGGWTSEGVGRKVTGGELVAGPHAYLFGLAAVIDNHGGTARERREKDAEGLLFRVKDGDTIEAEGTKFLVTVDRRRGYPKLSPVE